MSLLDLEHVRSALEAEKKQWYVEGTKTWEQALIENNERRDSDWYGTALVIADRISKIMREHHFFKEEDHTTHFLNDHHYDPVAHWRSVQVLTDMQKSFRHSRASIVLPVILAVIVLFVYFVLLSPPFTTWETRLLFFTGLAVIAGVAVLVGLFTGIIGGIVGLFVTGWLLIFSVIS